MPCNLCMNMLAAITSYYNPEHYVTRRKNYELFRDGMNLSNVPLWTIESAFGDDEFELTPGPRVIQVRGKHVMWQKERLLNELIRALPADIDQIAWLDCDLLFQDPNWGKLTEEKLKASPVVQLFESVVRLPAGVTQIPAEGESWVGFAAIQKRTPQSLLLGDFANHGHTGFAWAARREVLDGIGLYDACIAGSGDHMMAHTFMGDWQSKCIDRILCRNLHHHEHFERWSEKIYPRVKSKVDFLPLPVFHLWHGETADRRYVLRNRELASFQFHPEHDIKVGENGLWEWNSLRQPELKQWAVDYFRQRNEDR